MKKRFDPAVFFTTSLVAAVILVSLLAIPQWLMTNARWEILREHVADDARHAASVIDGDLQGKLDDPTNFSEELYRQALAPLVRFHSSDHHIVYVYTMVDRGGIPYFVLDTAASPDLKTNRKLQASEYMERFDIKPEYADDWLKKLALGQTYVTPTFETDKYGTFISGHAPIYDSKGNYVGFVGIDYDVEYYEKAEQQFTSIFIDSVITAIILSLLLGYGFNEYNWRFNVEKEN